MYDTDCMVAGQIDALFRKSDTGEYHMIDWKRCGKPLGPHDGERYKRRRGRAPCDFLTDNKFSHYAAQQNLYAVILRDCYGINVSSMWLVQLHENQCTYVMIPVPMFLSIARRMLDSCAMSAISSPKRAHLCSGV